MSGLPPGTLDPRVAGVILSVPVILNTGVKAGVTVAVAGWKAGWRAALPLAGCILVYLVMLVCAWAVRWL